MNQINVSDIQVYPIKSTSGIGLTSAWIDDLGLSFDRRFVLTGLNGQFITARTHPKLCLIQTNITANGFVITAPNMPILVLNYTGENADGLTTNYKNITVWSDTISAQLCSDNINQWFSQYIRQDCNLMYFGGQSSRQVKNTDNDVAFADGYPLLLISQASLDKLNEYSPRKNVMAQFRPNIVVTHSDAFAEDSWHTIQIGEVKFLVSKACSRCNFTTVDPNTGKFDSTQEPLTTLEKFRKDDKGDIDFGQNLIPLNQGQIKIGDKLEVLKTQSAKQYKDTQLSSTNVAINNTKLESLALDDVNEAHNKPVKKSPPKNKSVNTVKSKITINFDSWNTTHQGNTKDSILVQGENADLIMPYSCRAGNCGRCRVKLQSGDVEQLSTNGLMPDEIQGGYILSCVSIPKSDIVITKD